MKRAVIYYLCLCICLLSFNAKVNGATCQITKEKVAIIKEAFGQHYKTLMQNLYIQSGYKSDSLCVISGIAAHSIGGDAILILDKDDVYGAIYTDDDNIIVRTKKLDDVGIIDKWIEKHHPSIYPMIPYIIGHEPSYGKLEIVKDEDDYNICNIRIDDKVLKSFTADALSLSLVNFYKMGNEDVYLLFNNSGGTACPGMFQIVSIASNKKIFISEEFGTCNDIFSDRVDGGMISITITGKERNVIVVYKDGKLSIMENKISDQSRWNEGFLGFLCPSTLRI